MKLGNVSKRITAWLMCIAMLVGNVQATSASDVTSADAPVTVDETLSETSDQTEESEGDFVLIEAEDATETVSIPDADIADDEEETEESDNDETKIITVSAEAADGATVTVQGSENSFPEGEDYGLIVKSVTEEKELVDVMEENELSLIDYVAYDIELLVDGEVVEPTGNVTVTFENSLAIKSGKEDCVSVYHVDGNDLTEMENTSADSKAQTVEMETDHFSVYIVGLSTDTTLLSVVKSKYVTVSSNYDPDMTDDGSYIFTTRDSAYYDSVGNYWYSYYLQVNVYLDGEQVETNPAANGYFRYSSTSYSAYTSYFRIDAADDYELSKVTNSSGSAMSLTASGDYRYPLSWSKNGGSNSLNIYLTSKEDKKGSTETDTKEPVLYNKTSTVSSWDDRTYNIQIDAISKKIETTTTTKETPVDVVLVVDVSGSMLYRGDKVLKKDGTGTGLYSEVYQELDKSIQYVYKTKDDVNKEDAYSNNYYLYYSNTKGYWVRSNMSSGGETEMKSWADGYVYYSRIYQTKLALQNFVEQIASQSSSSKVGLVTFSGTLSGKQYSYAEMTTANKNALINHIWSITASGGTCPGEGLSLANNILSTSGDNNPKYVIMFTDGDPSGDGDGWNETNAYWAKYNAETAAKNVKKNASLYTIALSPSAANARWLKNTIATSSGYAYSINQMAELDVIFNKIVEEISNYVDITGATVTDILAAEFELTEDGKNQLKEMGATYKANSDGTTTIVWSNVTIPADSMLSYTFEVRAKDDFIGGNNVYTNDIQSNITADGKTYTLPHPMVNVKAEISVNDAEKTIFLGSTVPADADVLSGFFSETGNYTYQWYTDAECKNEISWEELGQATPGIDGATYYVKVSYVSVQPDPEALENTDNNYVGKGTLGYSAYDIGTYTIHVVDGTITVQKTISKTDYNAKQGDPIFTFKISNGTTSYYRTIRFTETDVKNASSDTVTLSATLTGIAKGNYTVEELESSNYTLKSVAVDAETSFDSSKNGNQVTFMVGDITKRYGKVTFTNTKGDSSLPRDTDTVNNTLKLGQKIVQTKDGDNGR